MTIHVLNPALRRGCVDDKVPSRELGAHMIVMWLIHANFSSIMNLRSLTSSRRVQPI